MASEAQGEVVIEVDVDSKGFDKGTIDVEKAIKSLESTLTKAVENMSKSISETLVQALKQVDSEIDRTEKKAKEAEAAGRAGSSGSSSSQKKYTDEYKDLADFVEQQEKNLSRLKEQQKIWDEAGFPRNIQHTYKGFSEKDNPLGSPADYKNLQDQIDDYDAAIKNAKEHMSELEANGQKFALTLSQELAKAADNISKTDFKQLDVSQYDEGVQKYVVNVNKANFAYSQQSDLLRRLEAQLQLLSGKEQTPEIIQKSDELQNKIEALKLKLEQLGYNSKTAQSALELALNPPVTLSQELQRVADDAAKIDFTPLDVSRYSESVRQYAINVNKANLEYEKQKSALAQVQAQLDFLKQQEQTPEVQTKITELENKIQELMVKLQQLGLNAENAQNAFDNAINGSKVGLSNIVGYFKNLELFPPTVKKIGSGVLQVAKGFKKVGSAISKAASHLNIFNRCQGKSADMSKKLVNQFTRIFTMVKSRIVRSFVSSLFSGITDGIKELSKADDTFNKRISELKSKFSQLKFAIMSAFEPLITYAAPVITKAISYINSLVDKIGQLMAALTGKNTYQKAQYNYKDYAKSLDDTKKSTDDLSESTKELNKQLASFDELNVLNRSSENDTSSTLMENNNAAAQVYAEIPVSFEISDLSKKIKDAFAAGDFSDIGTELGEKLNKQIAKIDSTKIGEILAKKINSASSFAIGFLTAVEWGELTEKITSNLNTLIDEVNTEQLGEAFAAVINTIFEIGFTFAENFNWEEFGTKTADFINSIFENTDWEKVGKTINSLIIGILDMILSFIDELNGDEIGDDISTVLNEIDIGGIVVRLAKIVWGIMKLAWKIITKMIERSDLLDFWKQKGEEWGEAIAEKVVIPIKETFRKAKGFFKKKGEELGESIANTFIIPVKDLIRDIKKAIKDGNWKQYFYDVFLAPIDILLNAIIDLINKISFDIPDFVPIWGGETFGFDIPHIPMPKFATGTVVPANYGEFAAILGDNKREPEVVSPISTMKQAFIEALTEVGYLGERDDRDIVIQIDRKEIFRAVKKENDSQRRRHGGKSQLA